jgi:hypothetical protein
MKLLAIVLKAPFKVADAIWETGRKTVALVSFGVLSRSRSAAKTFSPSQVKWYLWPLIFVFGLILDSLFLIVGLGVWLVVLYGAALLWVAVFGPLPPVHTW